jgi:2-C-methyl-D-erythritol 4-phosphate cytidylyltransferase / 2-C-methyl-D-erythritol 2,4-cyclodiphosphate synthase
VARGHADVVVVAAGTSQRFGGDKLDADVGGRPLLAWTIDRLASSDLVDAIVVVTSADRIDRVGNAPWLSSKVAGVVAGGARRQESVAHGIAAIAKLGVGASDEGGDRIVLVHDGARPLVTPALIQSVIEAVRTHGAAVPMVSIPDTVRRVGPDGQVLETLDRSGLAVAQTPQGARLSILQGAMNVASPAGDREFTDEAALLEACRIAVHAIPGDPSNFKVTVPADLARVDAILTGGASALVGIRVGTGHDSHPFGPGSPLVLGGLQIDGAPRLNGHSDGDVALHAIADAILGAAGLGDLGRVFPAGPETPGGIASTTLLGEVIRRTAAAGLRVSSLDVTIVGARPRLADRLDAIRGRVAELLEIDPRLVSIKASTGNLSGMEGAGRGISAEAIVILAAAP